MHKIYLLLRNNKQSGPHTLDEIRKLQLKAFDLIWVEGRSNAWAYPSEIEDLKAHVVESSKMEASGYPKSDSSLVLPRTQKANSTSSPASLNKVYVKLPDDYKSGKGNNEFPVPVADKLTAEAQASADEALNVKYTRTLDDIREQYNDWVYKQKTGKKPVVSSRHAWIAVISIVLLALAFVITRWNSEEQKPVEPMVIAPIEVKKNVTKETRKSSKKKVNAAKEKKTKKIDNTVTAAVNSKAETAETMKLPVPVPEEDSKPVESHSASLFTQVDIHYNYDTSNHHGISALRFTIKNRSEVKLNTVGVDVHYHFAGDHAPVKKTIYFNNIASHLSASASAPDIENATSVSFKLAFISTDERIYYGKE